MRVNIQANKLIALALATALGLSVGSTAWADKETREERTAKVNKEHGVQCKRIRETGSRTSKRVCTTKQQRDRRARQAQEDVDDLQRRAGPRPGGADG